MNPDELIAAIEKLGVQLSKTTINRYERERLISSPKRGSLGRGGGRWAEYPALTDVEAVVAWKMMNGQAVEGMRFSTEFTRYGRLVGFWNIAMLNEKEWFFRIPKPIDEIYGNYKKYIERVAESGSDEIDFWDEEFSLNITIPEIDEDIICEECEQFHDLKEKETCFCNNRKGRLWLWSEAQDLFDVAEQLHKRAKEEQKQMAGNEKYELIYAKLVSGRDALCDNYLSQGVIFAVRSYLKTYIEVMAIKEKNG